MASIRNSKFILSNISEFEKLIEKIQKENEKQIKDAGQNKAS